MNSSTRWFGWIAVVMVLHMAEQLHFGLIELERLKHAIRLYDGLFKSADTATVVLVTIGASFVYLLMFALLVGGRARFVALEVLGGASVLEVHHVIETIVAGAYTPGLVTALPYAGIGGLLMWAAFKEYRAATPDLVAPAVAGATSALLARKTLS